MSDAEYSFDVNGAAECSDGIPQGRLQRTARLAGLAAHTATDAIVARLRNKHVGADSAELHARSAERYAELLGHYRGVLMKAGQMLSVMSHTPLVPAEYRPIYQTALTRLRSEAPPMAPAMALAVLEHELGKPAAHAFAEFDCQPLAAASIGQVHAAKLHDGRAVAVKIQYPRVADAIKSDLKNAELLVTFLRLIGSMSSQQMRFDLRGAAHEMGLRILEELDYRLEAANQATFAEHYRGHPFIQIPEVVGELCTDRVLTQQLVTGRRWCDAIGAPRGLRDQWAEAICRFTYGSYNRFGLFHADPHPDNYVFHDDGSVSVLDFGCVKRFRRERVEACQAVMRAAYLDNDAVATWRAGLEAGFWQASDPVTPEEAFDFWRALRGHLCAEQPATLTPALVAECVEHCSPNGPSANAIRNITGSPEYVVMPRIEMGVLSVGAQLHATNDWMSIAAEWFEGAAPITEMGRREQAFFEARPGTAIRSCGTRE